MASVSERDQVANSVRRYARAHRRYERRHPEIFNPVEQARLAAALAAAVEHVRSGASPPRALDLGCGSGNVTRHLLDLGLDAVAADVSPHFLEAVRRRFGDRVETALLNGVDLGGIPDASLDLVTAYSVLHHIPDYLGMLDEIARVLRPGGVAFLDHEVTEAFWDDEGCVSEYRRALRRHELTRPGAWNPERRRWQRYLMPSKYVLGLRLLVDPDYLYGVEGDIHVWPHDHIEWPAIRSRLEGLGLEVVLEREYLNFNADYPAHIYEDYLRRGCADMRLLVARRPAAAS